MKQAPVRSAFSALMIFATLSSPCFTAALPRTEFPVPSYETPQWWVNRGREALLVARSLADNLQRGRAKSLVFFLGDGLGLTTTMAGRVYKGQLQNRSGEEAQLSYENFPHVALAKTYDTSYQTPDSASTATAFGSGVKTNAGTLGVNQNAQLGDCSSYDSIKDVYSFLHYAKLAGKSVGLVTTTRVTHATPAAMYAHSPHRDWESDASIPSGADQTRCRDIAFQLIANAADWNVVFGGGRLFFVPFNQTTIDHSNGNSSASGSRRDGVNLIDRWRSYQSARSRRFVYAESKADFDALDPVNTDFALGLFALSHMRYQLDNELDSTYREPSLTEMVEKAIRILSRNPNGFALFAEAGRIDQAHHANYAKRALHDVLELDRAVTRALELTSRTEALMLVTGDHSHVFTVGGWGLRGNPILGKVRNNDYGIYNPNGDALANDGLPFTVLNYADGPSAPSISPRINITNMDTASSDFQFPSLYNTPSESHGAEEVPVYASGPSAHLLHSTHEQSYIAHVVMYALCIGPDSGVWCASQDEAPVTTTGQPLPRRSSHLTSSSWLDWLLLLSASISAVR